MTDIIVSGHICLDLHPEMDNVALAQLPSPGKLFEVGGMAVSTGGAVSNTGLALYRLGVDVRLMANVGDDLIGQTILSVVQSYHPSLTETITIKPGTTGSYTVVLSPERSDRIFLHCPGTNAVFAAEDVRMDWLGDAKIFHLGYPSILPRLVQNDGNELVEIYQKVKSSGMVTSMDMSLPDPNGATGQANWRSIYERTLPYVDIFLPSLEEACFTLRRADFDLWGGKIIPNIDAAYLDSMADELLGMGAVITGFKLGEYGFYLRTGDDRSKFERLSRLNLAAWAGQRIYQPAFKVEVVGTTGAGDAAYGGFLTALLKGTSPQDAARYFCAVGAHNVEAADATSGIHSWEETQRRLNSGWAASQKRIKGFE